MANDFRPGSPGLCVSPLRAASKPTKRSRPWPKPPPSRSSSSRPDTGYFYVTKKNSRTMTDKLSMKKYDPVAKKHVEFKEYKIK